MPGSSAPHKTGKRSPPTPLARSGAAGHFGAPLSLLALIAVSAVFTPNFLSLGTLENTLVQGSPVVLVALGMTLVVSSGGIDISVGAIMAVSAAVSARLYTSDVPLIPSVAFGITAGGLCGLFNGTLIARWKIQPIVVTLVVMIAGRGLAHVVLGKPITSLLFTPFGDFGRLRIAGGVPVQIVVVAIAVGAMLFISKQTVFAKQVEAIGDNRRAARLVGINTTLVTMCVYVVCGVLCAIAGNMEAARNTAVNAGSLGALIELDAIAAVAIGGTPFSGGRARILGTVFGAIIVQLVTVIVNMNNMPFHYSLIFKAAIVVVALLAQRRE